MEEAFKIVFYGSIIGLLAICLASAWEKEKANQALSNIKIPSAINAILLLPCAYVTVINILAEITGVYYWPWTRSFLGFILPVVLLRCFFIPYICTPVFAIIHFCMLRKRGYPKKEVGLFILLLIISVLGLVSLEEVFWAAMSV